MCGETVCKKEAGGYEGVLKQIRGQFEELEKKVGAPIHFDVTTSRQIKAASSSNNKATPVRLAVAALLHQPSLALEIESVVHLENCGLAGVPLLTKIINTWKQEPSGQSGLSLPALPAE